MQGTPLQSGPSLIFAEREFPCGYAPRSILLSSKNEVLFVGSKEGALTVIQPKKSQSSAEPLGLDDFYDTTFRIVNPITNRPSPVRALCELDDERLLIGGGDGSVLRVNWRAQEFVSVHRPDSEIEHQVRSIVRLNPGEGRYGRYAISIQNKGLYIYDDADKEMRRSSDLNEPDLRNVRSLIPLHQPTEEDASSRTWLLVTNFGDLWLWGGEKRRAQKVTGVWSRGEQPGIISDYALIRSETDREHGRGARAVLLATDRSVYRLTLAPSSSKLLLSERLPLPGLRGMATSITYSEDETFQYLWVADAWGDSHLYWAPQREEQIATLGAGSLQQSATDTRSRHSRPPQEPSKASVFRSSGVMQAKAEVLVCFLWARARRKGHADLLFGQARRTDKIVLGRYWSPAIRPEHEPEKADDLRLRRLLSEGTWEGTESTLEQRKEALKKALRYLGTGEEDNFKDKALEKWKAHALLAELFERLSEKPELQKLLFDALRSPESAIADLILARGKASDLDEATRLWTQTLLGVIHRSTGDRQIAYLGLLQWLRRRQEEAIRAGKSISDKEVVGQLQRDIGIARKWGLSGEVNADREDLARPIEILRSQVDSNWREVPQPHPVALDLLTYEALLFHRSINLIERFDKGQLRGKTAWDLAVLDPEAIRKTRLVAISWMWGGIDLFEVRPSPEHPSRSRLTLCLRLPPEARQVGTSILGPPPDSHVVQQDKWGHSRAVHLGKLDQLLYAISAPTREQEGSGAREHLHLWTLKPPSAPGSPDAWTAHLSDSVELPDGESIYSLHELEKGSLVAGMRGVDGAARVAELYVEQGNKGHCVWSRSELEPIRLETRPQRIQAQDGVLTRRNRVWSIASQKLKKPRGDEAASRSEFRLIVGTEAGQIRRIALPITPQERQEKPPPIATCSSPVLCLAYKERRPGDARVYAGCEDGSILAWQELPSEKELDRDRFAVLWATREEGPISALHLLDFRENGGDPDRLGPAVLAVTRQGRTVLLDDRAHVDWVQPGSQPSRFPVPGTRFGRLALPDSAFSSVLWMDKFGLASHGTDDLGGYATLLSASGEGTLSLISLHTPAKTLLRKKRYKDILNLWKNLVSEKGVDWRLGEAVFRAAPILALITVRWLLDPAFPPDVSKGVGEHQRIPEPQEEGFKGWWLPRHLRPLRTAIRRWPTWCEDDSDADFTQEQAREVGRAIETALRRSWRLDDLDLFQEIASLALKRANFEVYGEVDRSIASTPGKNGNANLSNDRRRRHANLEALYTEVYQAVERSLQLWLGAPHRKEARARAAVAKHMVDGDTAWRLFLAAANERDEHAPHSSTRGSLEQILQRRITGVRELVHKRDPLVSLEALRAANLSLMRLCKRLVRSRERVRDNAATWRPSGTGQPTKTEIQWRIFQPYFERLTAAAERTFGTRQEQSDAIAHEHTRTFALAICACPSGLRLRSGSPTG